MKTLKQIMDLNENFHLMVKAAPNCPWDEGQKLEGWFLDCVEVWLTEKLREYPSDCYAEKGVIDELLEELK